MAEISIEPFGQTSEMPAGIRVIDNLNSTSSGNALSARQGKVLKSLIDAKADEEVTITRFAVNLCDAGKMQSGKELDNSGAVISGSGIVTDFIPIALSAKTQYLQVCCSVFKSNAFGYRAAKVCTYNGNKVYIGAISNVSAIIDKESQDNASRFINAEYIRVQYAAGTTTNYATDFYVALTNKPVLPQYSPYDKDVLTASTDWVAPKIRNTDGAISNMLETALDYVHNLTNQRNNGYTGLLDLGYGDSATAYDESCVPVTPDPWDSNQNYGSEEQKKQINCSTFVQLCLEGVRYINSRYALGSSARNIGVNGYVFDDHTETNYHNAINGARFVPCSSHNKLYANRQLKYAYERGFAFLIEDGFKNLEVGDVIFSSNSSSDYFKNVGHTLFVSAVCLNSNGTKTISIMEDGHSGVNETTGITTRDTNWIYAARFPLPCIASKAKNIVSGVTKESAFSSLGSGATKVIGTLALIENVKAKGVYTAVVKCSAVGNFEVMVGTISDGVFIALGTNGQGLFRRDDGVTVKHFHIPVSSSVNTDSLSVAIKTYAALNSNVEIVEAKVYNGYVTE